MRLFKNTSQQGDAAEALAAEYLKAQGLKHISSHYCSRFGEIDLIMQDKDTLVFIEVRLRKNSQFGGAAASINSSKQHKIVMTAEHYLQVHGNASCRFDAILMDSMDTKHITWIKDAFQA
jgi:putative endonuclease